LNASNGGEDIHQVETYGRYIRITGEQRATQYGVSIFEFEVIGATGPVDKPQITITSPANGEVLKKPENITLDVDVTSTGPIQIVNYFNQGMLIGSSDTKPFSFIWEDFTGENFSISANAINTGNVTGNSSAVSFSVDYNTAIGERATQNQLQIYPVPAKDYIKVKAANVNSIEVITIEGHSLIETKPSQADRESEITIPIHTLKPGIYFLRLNTSDGIHVSTSFVKL
jgi:hypothetical protein